LIGEWHSHTRGEPTQSEQDETQAMIKAGRMKSRRYFLGIEQAGKMRFWMYDAAPYLKIYINGKEPDVVRREEMRTIA
jgi:hypothetical protein